MGHLPQYFKFVRWMLTSSLNVLAALYCWFAFILDRFVLFAQVVYFVAAIFRRLIADKSSISLLSATSFSAIVLHGL